MKVTPYFNSLTPLPLHYTTLNFHGGPHGATMTIKGSLQVSIDIVKSFLSTNFCPIKNWPKFPFLERMGSKCHILFSGIGTPHPKKEHYDPCAK